VVVAGKGETAAPDDGPLPRAGSVAAGDMTTNARRFGCGLFGGGRLSA
jgi:hypothetical protein